MLVTLSNQTITPYTVQKHKQAKVHHLLHLCIHHSSCWQCTRKRIFESKSEFYYPGKCALILQSILFPSLMSHPVSPWSINLRIRLIGLTMKEEIRKRPDGNITQQRREWNQKRYENKTEEVWLIQQHSALQTNVTHRISSIYYIWRQCLHSEPCLLRR